MNKLSYSLKSKTRLIGLVLISFIFITSGISSFESQEIIYGNGFYYSSSFFLSAILYFLIILFNIQILILIFRKYVLVVDSVGIHDYRIPFFAIRIPWIKVLKLSFEGDSKTRQLLIYLKPSKSTKVMNFLFSNIIRISIRNLNINEQEVANYFINKIP